MNLFCFKPKFVRFNTLTAGMMFTYHVPIMCAHLPKHIHIHRKRLRVIQLGLPRGWPTAFSWFDLRKVLECLVHVADDVGH